MKDSKKMKAYYMGRLDEVKEQSQELEQLIEKKLEDLAIKVLPFSTPVKFLYSQLNKTYYEAIKSLKVEEINSQNCETILVKLSSLKDRILKLDNIDPQLGKSFKRLLLQYDLRIMQKIFMKEIQLKIKEYNNE